MSSQEHNTDSAETQESITEYIDSTEEKKSVTTESTKESTKKRKLTEMNTSTPITRRKSRKIAKNEEKNVKEDTENEEKGKTHGLRDDFVELMKAQGLDQFASESGLLDASTFTLDHIDTTTQSSIKAETLLMKEEEIYPTPKPARASRRRELLPSNDSSSAKLTPTNASMKSAGPKTKHSKGLRHFSMKVCQKVEEKGVTSYNEVADDLVRECVTTRPNDGLYDEKNVRRRVYDALNVLMAIDIISKDRKEIRWKGLPSNLQHDTEMLVAERTERLKRVDQKKQHLQDLLVQQVAMTNLLKRNRARAQAHVQPPSMDSPLVTREDGRIALPFIAVNTDKDTVIQCEMSEDRQDLFFNFSAPFEINDDTEILRKLQLHRSSYEELKKMIPDKMMSYLPAECAEKSES